MRELRVLRVQRAERLGRGRRPTVRPARPSETAVRSASACSQHRASAPSAIIGSAVASCTQHRGAVDDERPPGGERAEPLHVVDLAERRAARRVDEAPEERAQRALERGGRSREPSREAVELAKPEARVVRRRAAAGAEVVVLAARVERVAAEPDREHLEGEVCVRIGAVAPTPRDARSRGRGSPPACGRSSSRSLRDSGS